MDVHFVNKQNRSYQSSSNIPVIELADATHKHTYREFVLSNDNESITIDEAEKKYAEQIVVRSD